MTQPTRTPALQAALDALAAAEDALDPFVRIQMAMETLKAGGVHSTHPAEARQFWLALHSVINSGATPERLDHLVSTLEVGGSTLRQALVITARKAVTGDKPRSAVWRALVDVADSVVE